MIYKTYYTYYIYRYRIHIEYHEKTWCLNGWELPSSRKPRKVQAMNDGTEGFVSLAGNQGTTYLEASLKPL